LNEEEKNYEYDELYHELFSDDEESEQMVHSKNQEIKNSEQEKNGNPEIIVLESQVELHKLNIMIHLL
jgi:hypothetical protein